MNDGVADGSSWSGTQDASDTGTQISADETGEEERNLSRRLNKAMGAVPSHVPAFLEFSGQRVGINGVGSGPTFGMIPKSWDAGQMTNTYHWIKVLATPVGKQKPIQDTHYEIMDPDWRPKQVTFHQRNERRMVAVAMDSAASCHADWITLSNYTMPADHYGSGCPMELHKDTKTDLEKEQLLMELLT